MNPTLQRIQALKAALATESAASPPHYTLGEILVLLEPVELALCGIVFCAPFLQPVPMPGLSTPIGLTLAALSLLTLFGKDHKALPKRLRERKIDLETVRKILLYSEKMLIALGRIPHWSLGRAGMILARPRALASHMVFMALLLSLPLPIPFSNAIPAWGIVFGCLAMLEANGIFILLSYLTLAGNLVFFGSLILVAAKTLWT